MSCAICGYPEVHAKGRCHPCYRYLRRTGRDRPEDVWVRTEHRRVLAELEALAWGPFRTAS